MVAVRLVLRSINLERSGVLVFLVTRIGCGIAGFTDRQMAPLFANANDLPNVALPELWRWIYAEKG